MLTDRVLNKSARAKTPPLQRNRGIVASNGPHASVDSDVVRTGPTKYSLITRFSEQVATNANKTAITIEDARTYSYDQLNKLADNLALYIFEVMSGLDIDTAGNDTPLVSVMMGRDVGIVTSILAILKVGAAYVPVDPSFPPDRQTYIFNHSRCHLAVLDEECVTKARELGLKLPPTVIVSSRTGEVSVMQAPLSTARDVLVRGISMKLGETSERELGGLAYVLFTSGSTG